jgi:hypothetical protein
MARLKKPAVTSGTHAFSVTASVRCVKLNISVSELPRKRMENGSIAVVALFLIYSRLLSIPLQA